MFLGLTTLLEAAPQLSVPSSAIGPAYFTWRVGGLVKLKRLEELSETGSLLPDFQGAHF